jgi:hypothetical protein
VSGAYVTDNGCRSCRRVVRGPAGQGDERNGADKECGFHGAGSCAIKGMRRGNHRRERHRLKLGSV